MIVHELTLHNWKQTPPQPFTGRIERKFLRWSWSLSSGGKEIVMGWSLRRERGWQAMMKMMNYATTA
jgi:hypothetical protein